MSFRLIVACLLAAVAAPAFAGETPAAVEPVPEPHVIAPMTLRIMTFNIWYGGEQVSLAKVAEAIRAADADIVGIEEADGSLRRLAELAGYPYVDERRRILSRFPLFDPGTGERTDIDTPPYSLIGLDRKALHAWVEVRPGEVVAVAVTHLSSDPSGLELARQGKRPEEVLKVERDLRLPEAQPLTALARTAADGTPVFLLGDFNTPSHLDWTPAVAKTLRTIPYPLEWPVSKLLADAGLRDSYREAHPDPVRTPGLTWTAGQPAPILPVGRMFDRIDFIYTAGNSRTIASRIVGEPGGPDVDIAIDPYPSDHRAVVSTFTTTPAAAPALLAVEPRRVMAGGTFRLRAHDPARPRWTAVVVRRGDPAERAITGLYDVNALYQTSVALSTFGLAPGPYDALLLDKAGTVIKRTAFAVAAADAAPSLTVEPRATPGASVTVRWANTEGNARDWIAVYRAGVANASDYGAWVYTQAMFDGSATVTAPAAPGQYELRLMRDETYEVLAAAPLTVDGPARR